MIAGSKFISGIRKSFLFYAPLGVGGVHGDATREMVGRFVGHGHIYEGSGIFIVDQYGTPYTSSLSGQVTTGATLRISRVAPTALKNQPRAWGSLICVCLDPSAS